MMTNAEHEPSFAIRAIPDHTPLYHRLFPPLNLPLTVLQVGEIAKLPYSGHHGNFKHEISMKFQPRASTGHVRTLHGQQVIELLSGNNTLGSKSHLLDH